jgi:hypothetical protein
MTRRLGQADAVQAGNGPQIQFGGRLGQVSVGKPTGAQSRADRAARAAGPVGDGGLPPVAGRAAPPQPAPRVGGDAHQVEAGVAERVDLGGDVGVGVEDAGPDGFRGLEVAEPSAARAFHGSLGAHPPTTPVVGAALLP